MRNSLPVLLALTFSTQLAFWGAQGLGFFEQPLLVALGQRPGDTATPPLLQNLAFALRFFVALASDLYSPCGLGHRLPYIVVGQALAAAALVSAGAVPPTPGAGWSAYLAAAFVRSAGIVAATCAMDGLLVDAAIGGVGAVEGGSMGRVQAARATGQALGLLLVNLGGGALADAQGLAALAFLLAALTLPWAAAPLALGGCAVEERAPASARATEEAGSKLRAARLACAGSLRALASAPAAAALALSVLTFAGSTVGNFPLVLFLVGRKRLTLLDNGALNTIFAVCAWPGSLLAAYLLDRVDMRTPTAGAQLLTAALTAAVLYTPSAQAFAYNAALNVAGGLATGFVTTATNAFVLRLAPPGMAATFVALILGASNAGGMLGNVLVGQIAMRGDYFEIAFWAGAGILAAGVAVVPFVGAAAAPPARGAQGGVVAVAGAGAGGGEAQGPAAAGAAAAVGAAEVAVPNPLAAGAVLQLPGAVAGQSSSAPEQPIREWQ